MDTQTLEKLGVSRSLQSPPSDPRTDRAKNEARESVPRVGSLRRVVVMTTCCPRVPCAPYAQNRPIMSGCRRLEGGPEPSEVITQNVATVAALEGTILGQRAAAE
jgi:hypothetical protein